MFRASTATHSDLDWMTRLYHQAVAHGHFSTVFSGQESNQIIQRNLISAINSQQLVDFNLRASAIVFSDRYKRIGFTLMTDILTITEAFEIHLFVVDRKRRRHGYGRKMLRYLIDQWNQQHDLYARCFPQSTGMIHLLEKHGFDYLRQNDEGASIYRKYAHCLVNKVV